MKLWTPTRKVWFQDNDDSTLGFPPEVAMDMRAVRRRAMVNF